MKIGGGPAGTTAECGARGKRMGVPLPEDLERYAAEHTGPVSPLLEEIERETRERTGHPGMLTGRVEGTFLRMLVGISGARRVVDIGTFTGYSALMMAEGLPEDGLLITCEIVEAHADMARRFFARSPHGRKIRLAIGPAIGTLRGIEDRSVDFVFIDADKGSYTLYYEESLRILKPGGLVVADNAFWHGRVLSPRDDDDRAIASFNRTVREDERVEKVLLTVRDGIYLIRKR
jgi:caffeoyl-CoA O-methyltransferase